MEAGFLCGLDLVGQDADDVRAATIQRFDLCRFYIEAGDAEAFFAEEKSEGKAYVAHAYDADAGFAGLHSLFEGFKRGDRGDGHVFLIVEGCL